MRNSKNNNTATHPFLDRPPDFALQPFSSKIFQAPPFLSLLEKLNPPPLYEGSGGAGGGGLELCLPFLGASIRPSHRPKN